MGIRAIIEGVCFPLICNTLDQLHNVITAIGSDIRADPLRVVRLQGRASPTLLARNFAAHHCGGIPRAFLGPLVRSIGGTNSTCDNRTHPKYARFYRGFQH